LVEERRVQAVASALFTGDASEGDTLYSRRDGGGRVIVSKREIMSNEKRVAWGQGVSMVSDCRPDIGVHALVKVNDKNGECLGQGVVDLGGTMETALGGGVGVELAEVDMALGGRLVGGLEAKFIVGEMFRAGGGGGGGGEGRGMEDANVV
jgi:hypothetical protein